MRRRAPARKPGAPCDQDDAGYIAMYADQRRRETDNKKSRLHADNNIKHGHIDIIKKTHTKHNQGEEGTRNK